MPWVDTFALDCKVLLRQILPASFTLRRDERLRNSRLCRTSAGANFGLSEKPQSVIARESSVLSQQSTGACPTLVLVPLATYLIQYRRRSYITNQIVLNSKIWHFSR